MSLYGALFTGVTGLSTQGQKIGVISDNIANVNTVGYKKAEATFQSLVVSSDSATSYAPGGVRATARYSTDTQGLLSSTSSATDIAMSGSGFFAVNAKADGSGQPVYTRAGSFRQDENGDFVNAAGYYLMAWPLSSEGLKPGDPGNADTTANSTLDSLRTVNVQSSVGKATPTAHIDLGMNLDAGEDIYAGSGVTVTMDAFSPTNYGISADDIIVPDETNATAPSYGLSVTNGIARGDQITISTGNGLRYDYEYGGFIMGRDVGTSASTNIGDGGVSLAATAFGAGEITTDGATNTVTVTLPVTMASLGYATGDRIKLSGITLAAADIPLSEINATQTITVTGANTFTFAVSTTSTTATSNLATGTYTDRLYAGNILDATTATQAFFSTTSLSDYTSAARSFTIATPSTGTSTFTYTAGSPSTSSGQFNNLTNLASAIDEVVGLTARVVDGRLVVGAEDASEAVTFANVDATGTSALDGINWVEELDLVDIASGSRRFSTMQGLANLVNDDEGVSAILTDPLGASTLELHVDDPLDTVQFTDYVSTGQTLAAGDVTVGAGAAGVQTVTVSLAGHGLSVGDNIIFDDMTAFAGFTTSELNAVHTITNVIDADTFEIEITSSAAVTAVSNADGVLQNTNRGSLLAELGLVDSLQGTTSTPAVYAVGDTGALGPEYDSSGVVGMNMASGDIAAQFSRTVRIYDALGAGHDIRYSFIKTSENQWAVEVHAVNEDEVNSSLVDGQLAVGTITFNGDGSLRSVSTTLSGSVSVNWTNGSSPTDVAINFGTSGLPFGTIGATAIGDTDGLTQFSDDYNVAFVNQDGAPVGELVGVSIDESGFVIASYSNGESESLYQIPIADFMNPNGLKPISGNVYAQTQDSGELNLRDAGTNGTGTIVSSSLEQSNVDLASELTDMIVAQRAYQANTRVISTSSDLLDQLNKI